jgi:drug/metabolite transporter (DMT)-like permease
MPHALDPLRTALLTSLALVAFAGNSLLCRLALKQTSIDPASFTSVRLASGALVLALLVAWRGRGQPGAALPWAAGDWTSALALFVYAAGFSFAYVSLSAATGALLLFGVVQTTMIGWACGAVNGCFRCNGWAWRRPAPGWCGCCCRGWPRRPCRPAC